MPCDTLTAKQEARQVFVLRTVESELAYNCSSVLCFSLASVAIRVWSVQVDSIKHMPEEIITAGHL